MPKVKAGQLTVNYESQGSGEPIILIPYLAADNACYAFQVAEYAKHFTCISMDLPGTGESDPLKSGYSTEDLADHVNGADLVREVLSDVPVGEYAQRCGVDEGLLRGAARRIAAGGWAGVRSFPAERYYFVRNRT